MKKINSREIKYLNAYGPYEHGIWNSQNGSLVANLQLAGSMLFFQRSIELVEQISSSLLGIFTRKELKNKTICDIGCYDGWILHMLNEEFKFKKAIGVEPRVKNINKGIYARFFYDIKTDVKFKIGTINSAQELFDKETFDIVLNLGTLHHVSSTPDSVKVLTELTKDILIIDSMVIPTPEKDKKKILKFLNLKDLVYFGEKKSWAVAAYKFESPYFDGSTAETKIVNVPEERLIQMALTANGFEVLTSASPEENHYSRSKQKLRGVKEALIVSRRTTGTASNMKWEDKIYEHELMHITEKIDPQIIIKWLLKMGLKKEAEQLNSYLQSYSLKNIFRVKILYLFSKSPTNMVLKFIASRVEKSSSSLEILSNLSRAPVDKINLELGKFYLSRKMFDISSTFFHSIIDRPGADWRSFYRACYLLSCIKVKQKSSTQSREYLELLVISNPNFPIKRLKALNY
jgi:2-polyprenyl-3-methyl-5-hydroxy-6-metoxy-1,4-benzoquinol methylase